MISEELYRPLRRIATEQGDSMAAVIREALEEIAHGNRPRPRILGIGASGHADTARKASDERPVPLSTSTTG